jgi:hypothetical protein
MTTNNSNNNATADHAARPAERPWRLSDAERAANKSSDIDMDKLHEINKSVERQEELRLEQAKVKAGKSAVVRRASPDDVVLEIAMSGDKTAQVEYLVDPWLPRGQVVGFFGRGATAKTSFIATLAAGASERVSTLWVSTEEPIDWIKRRHTEIGGEDGSLFVVKALVTKKDALGKALSSNFNVYVDLEAAIEKAHKLVGDWAEALNADPRPLRLVVLDTAVALTTWGKSESPNDDASVKRLLAFLLGLCEKHDVTIAIIGHSNKGKHDNLTDTVAGSSAWVNSPRQAFTHICDKRAEYSYVACTVKSTLTGTFAAEYSTHPVYTLARREQGPDSVLCRVNVAPIEWGFENAMALVDAALGRDEPLEEVRDSPKQIALRTIEHTVLNLLQAGGKSVDRDAVHVALGYKPERRHWKEVDHALQTQHDVTIRKGAHGKIWYEKN